MNYRNISHFRNGLVTAGFTRGHAPLTSLLQAENIRIHNGGAEPRKGQKYVDRSDSVDAQLIEWPIRIVYEYSREHWDATNEEMIIYREYVFSYGNALYGWTRDEDYSDSVDEINFDTGPGDAYDYPFNSDDIWATEYADWMWICNGMDGLYKYDAISFYKVGISQPEFESADVAAVAGAVLNPATGYRKYKYRYIHAVRDGSLNLVEYSAGPFSDEVTSPDFNNGRMNITLEENTSDPQATHIELYATEIMATLADLDGADFYRLDSDNDPDDQLVYDGLSNADQTYTDAINNTVPGGGPLDISDSEYHPMLTSTDTWEAPPDGLKYILYHKDRIYGVDGITSPSWVLYTDLGNPESWKSQNWFDVRQDDGDVITGLAVRGSALYIFKQRSIWIMVGDPEANPAMEVKAGGDSTSGQTEFGLGCSAPRSIAAYGDDILIFYSSVNGVWMISSNGIENLSKNVDGITGLSDACSGAVYVDAQGEPFYVLSPPSGNAWVCHLPSRAWVNDTNVNVSSFCVDHDGWLVGPVGTGYLNRYYHPDYTDDNGAGFVCKLKTAWLNLRDGVYDAVVRMLQVQSENILDECIVTTENQDGQTFTATFGGYRERRVNAGAIAGRIFTFLFSWKRGTIESMTAIFKRRKGH